MNRMPTLVSNLPPRLASKPPRRRALITLTPLIDVVFILLVFFMLASSFLDWRAIELDAPASATAGGGMEGAVLVEILPGALRVSGQVVSIESLARAVSERIERVPTGRVLVRPAAGVPLQDAVDVLDRLSLAGINGISLVRTAR